MEESTKPESETPPKNQYNSREFLALMGGLFLLIVIPFFVAGVINFVPLYQDFQRYRKSHDFFRPSRPSRGPKPIPIAPAQPSAPSKTKKGLDYLREKELSK